MDPQGQDVANPIAMVLSSTMMLRHLGLDFQADSIARAVYTIIEQGKIRTPDMGGKNHTSEVTR
jgi:isocitrate dehydrogenase (NAD+)